MVLVEAFEFGDGHVEAPSSKLDERLFETGIGKEVIYLGQNFCHEPAVVDYPFENVVIARNALFHFLGLLCGLALVLTLDIFLIGSIAIVESILEAHNLLEPKQHLFSCEPSLSAVSQAALYHFH